MNQQFKTKRKRREAMLRSDTMTDMLSLISELQSERMDSQRAELRPARKEGGASLPGARAQATTCAKPEDDFLDMIARVQSSRLEDQRSELPPPKPKQPASLPDDDFFAQLMKAQSGRLDDQRATIPLQDRQNKAGSNSKK